MEDENLKTLKNIERILAELKVKSDVEEMTADSDKIITKVEAREEYAIQQIQTSFDRLHDKVFSFNNIVLSIFLVLATFPQENPIAPVSSVIVPLLILVFIIFLDWRQMEIHRFASNEMNWTQSDRDKYGRKIRSQTLLSLLMLILSATYLIALLFILKSH